MEIIRKKHDNYTGKKREKSKTKSNSIMLNSLFSDRGCMSWLSTCQKGLSLWSVKQDGESKKEASSACGPSGINRQQGPITVRAPCLGLGLLPARDPRVLRFSLVNLHPPYGNKKYRGSRYWIFLIFL